MGKIRHWIMLSAALAVNAATPAIAWSQKPLILANKHIRAEFAGASLAAITNLDSGFRLRFSEDTFSFTLEGIKVQGASLPYPKIQKQNSAISILYETLQYRVKVIYELKPDWHFLSKQLVLEYRNQAEYRVNEIQAFSAVMDPAAADELLLSTNGSWGALLRFAPMPEAAAKRASGIFLLYQNPFNLWNRDGRTLAAFYRPEMEWKMDYGPYVSDRFCMGPYRLSGTVFPARAVPEWTFVPDYERHLRDNAIVDMAEVDALVECVRSFLMYRPQRSIRIHVPWCENDYQIDVASDEGWTEFRRIIDRAAELGCQYTLFTPENSELASRKENRDAWGWENLLFFGMGQKIRKGEWDPAKDPVPPSLRQKLAYAASKNIRLISYSYPSLPFMQNPDWTRWAGDKVGGYNGPDMGLRSFQDWWLGKLVDFARATGAGGYSFDHWWIAYDGASSRYAQWAGCRRILESLRQQIPDVVIDGRQQYMNFGPWTWLAGSYPHPTLTDEQPESFVSFPDLHTDRVSANRQRFAAWTYRMQRFAPPEILPGFITHQTERADDRKVMRRDRFRVRDWDMLGWKFSLLSSIGTAPFNHVVNYLPARDPDEFGAFSDHDKRWFREWLDWTDANMAILRNLKPILGPPMIGRVDGTAACAGNRGFLFLFNPNYRKLEAEFKLDESIGLGDGSQFLLEELYPEKGLLIGNPQSGSWKRGASVKLALPGNQVRVVAVRPADATGSRPLLFNVRGTAALAGRILALTNVEGETGSSCNILVRLPSRRKIAGLTVNGIQVPYAQDQDIVTARVQFAGELFSASQAVWNYDPSFTGGTIKAAFRIPPRVFDQLRARRQAWPLRYTDDDLIAPWLGAHRLILYAHIAEPDDSKEITIAIDRQAVPVKKAWNNIYGNNKRNFLGFYVDVTSLEPGTDHSVQVNLPELAPGRFQGLFFENVETEFTRQVLQK
jgi:hypothetical protein